MEILLWITGGLIVCAVLIAAFRTGKPVRSLLLSGVEGLCALAAVNIAGTFTGIALGLNVFTGVFCALLGIPGVITLLLLKMIFGV